MNLQLNEPVVITNVAFSKDVDNQAFLSFGRYENMDRRMNVRRHAYDSFGVDEIFEIRQVATYDDQGEALSFKEGGDLVYRQEYFLYSPKHSNYILPQKFSTGAGRLFGGWAANAKRDNLSIQLVNTDNPSSNAAVKSTDWVALRIYDPRLGTEGNTFFLTYDNFGDPMFETYEIKAYERWSIGTVASRR
ncbi:hypothetical protein [Phaeobacter sp.]|uniref:hypothetical protein n=1 Tax=Phaeobacter sp. TaxID=1902409 RepID=UPI0025CB97A2|nr:hypothetical protein [Phaeobacter sp.]